MPAESHRLKIAASILLALICGVACIPVAVALGFYIVANGLTVGACALAALLALLALVAVRARTRAARVPLTRLTIAFFTTLVSFAIVRVASVSSGAPIVYCVDGQCPKDGPLLSRLVREDESAMSGLTVASALGGVYPAEEAVAQRVFREKYERLNVLRAGLPGVNALVLSLSDSDAARTITYLPPGRPLTPAVVFLHGSGGAMSAYTSTLLESRDLANFAIVAPVLDAVGLWLSERAMQVLERTLDTLPGSIDRSRVYLVGLSNGAVGATVAASRPDLAPRFRAAVAIEGIASSETLGSIRPIVPLLVLAARDDERFELDYVRERTAAMRNAGAPVELSIVEGTHMAFFSNSAAFLDALSAWFATH